MVAPRRPTAKPGIEIAGVPRRRTAWLSVISPSPATLKVPGMPVGAAWRSTPMQVVLVEELQARVEAEDARDHRQPEVAGERARPRGGR